MCNQTKVICYYKILSFNYLTGQILNMANIPKSIPQFYQYEHEDEDDPYEYKSFFKSMLYEDRTMKTLIECQQYKSADSPVHCRFVYELGKWVLCNMLSDKKTEHSKLV